MKAYGPQHTIAEILAEMVEEDQAINMISLSVEEGTAPDFLIIMARAPYSIALEQIVKTIGDEVAKSQGGYTKGLKYALDENGNHIPFRGEGN